MPNVTSLCDLLVGEFGVVKELLVKDEIRRRFQDLGLVEDTKVQCVQVSPLGDPKAYFIRGAIIAIRNEDACGVIVNKE